MTRNRNLSQKEISIKSLFQIWKCNLRREKLCGLQRDQILDVCAYSFEHVMYGKPLSKKASDPRALSLDILAAKFKTQVIAMHNGCWYNLQHFYGAEADSWWLSDFHFRCWDIKTVLSNLWVMLVDSYLQIFGEPWQGRRSVCCIWIWTSFLQVLLMLRKVDINPELQS